MILRVVLQLLGIFFVTHSWAYESPATFTLPMIDVASAIAPIPENPTPTQVAVISYNTASLFAADLINNNTCQFPDILPNTKLVLDIKTDYGIPSRAIQQFIEFADAGHTMILGFPLPDSAVPTAIVGSVYGVAQLASFAPSDILSDKKRFPYFSRISTTTSEQIHQAHKILQYYSDVSGPGWTDIGILCTIDEYNIDYATTFIQLAPKEFTFHAYQQFLEQQEDIHGELVEVKQSAARIILALVQGDYDSFLEKANDEGLIGEEYVWMATAARVGFLFHPNELARGTLAATNYFPDTSPFRDCFFQAWANADPVKYPFAGKGTDPSTITYFPFDSMMIAALAIDTLDKMEMLGKYISPELWSEVIRSTTFSGITGLVSFDNNGDRIGDISIRYYDPDSGIFRTTAILHPNGELEQVEKVVWFSGSTTTPDLDIRPPFDYWSCKNKEKRTDETGKTVKIRSPDGSADVDEIASSYYCDLFIDCHNLSDETTDCPSNYLILFIVFGIITGMCIMIAILLIFFVAIFGIWMKYQRLRVASPFFLILLLISIIVGFSSIFSFFGKPHTVACVFQPWLLGLSSISMIATLSAKNFRIWRLFKYPLKKTKITDFELLLLWVIIMIPGVFILLLWTIISTPTATMAERAEKEHYVCTTGGFTGEPGGLVFFSILVAYSAVVLLFGAVISILCRNAPTLFNETKVMTISIYNLAFLGVVIIPVYMSIQSIDPFIAWILRACAILYAFSATMFLQFLPKLYGVFFLDKGKNIQLKNILFEVSSTA